MSDKRLVTVPEGCIGDWSVDRFVIERDTPRVFRYALKGRGIRPGTYTRLSYRKNVIMSDTPAEQRDHVGVFWAIEREGGRILINGLGLGMTIKAALDCEAVEHIDVVELAADVIGLVGSHYLGFDPLERDPTAMPPYTSDDRRLTIHHGDAYTIQWPPHTHWNVAWHDIWADLNTGNLEEMARLHRRYGRRVDWQGSWGKELLQRQRDHDRRYAFA